LNIGRIQKPVRKSFYKFADSFIFQIVCFSIRLHRYLKYENVLFVTPDPKLEIKLIDFGISQMFVNGLLTEGVGTM
jgi:serine/threonine protein kinase